MSVLAGLPDFTLLYLWEYAGKHDLDKSGAAYPNWIYL